VRVLHFSTSDAYGGAAQAAYRLHTAMRAAGHSSQMLVRDKRTTDADVAVVPQNLLIRQLRKLQGHLPLLRPTPARFTFNHDLESGMQVEPTLEQLSESPDLICLHWVSEFLTARKIAAIYHHFQKPMLWVLMDQEPLTGGCHYSFGCRSFMEKCGRCPLLESKHPGDASRDVWYRKRHFLADLPIIFIAPTSWAADRARESSLFGKHRIEPIPLPIDDALFQPADRTAARSALNLPAHQKILLFGCNFLNEPRKGIDQLLAALDLLHRQWQANPLRDELLLLVAGQADDELTRRLPFASRLLGRINEHQLAQAYQAADLYVSPSIEDAGPMMIPEALLCGTPVVAFQTGGAPDLIVHRQTGYLARHNDFTDLAAGIEWCLRSSLVQADTRSAVGVARKLHSPANVIARYEELCERIGVTHRWRMAG